MWKGFQGEGSVRCPHGDPSNERMPSLRKKVSEKTGQLFWHRILTEWDNACYLYREKVSKREFNAQSAILINPYRSMNWFILV